jgi:hypothetical protein
MISVLEKAGFVLVGEWLADGESIKLSVRPEKGPAVYAFLLDGELVYIGKTESCMQSRMNGYRNGKRDQRTNIRIRGLIVELLKAGRRIQVLAARPEPLEWNGLPVNTVPGLESGLIAMLRPAWNMLNNSREANGNGQA